MGKQANLPAPKRADEAQTLNNSKRRNADFAEWGLFVAVMVWTFVSLCFPCLDMDFWWHLKTGNWIIEHGAVPYTDLYTYMDADKPWIDLHWGFQVLVAVLYRVGGLPLVTLSKAATITLAVAVAWSASGPNLRPWKKAAIWFFAIICICGRGNERPEMLTQLFLASWLWLARVTDDRPKWIWWLIPLQLAWVNCHALFVLGLIVGFAYGVDAVIRHYFGGHLGLEPRTAGPKLSIVWIVGGLVVVACFVNPYFEQGAIFPLTLYRKFSVEKEFYSRNIGEFRPPIDFVMRFGIGNIYVVSELFVWLIGAASFIRLWWVERKWSPYRLILFAAYSHLAWQASRNTNIFAFVSTVIACQNFGHSSASVARSVVERHLARAKTLTYSMTAVIGCLILMVVTGTWNEFAERNKPFGLGEAPNWFIHAASKFAAQPGFPERAFVAHIGQADVYVYHNGPKYKVFMDARLEVCSQQTFQKLNDALAAMASGSSRWHAALKDEDLPVVILDSRTVRNSIAGLHGNPNWRLVYADPSAAVFLHKTRADKLNLPEADHAPLMYPDGPPKRTRS